MLEMAVLTSWVYGMESSDVEVILSGQALLGQPTCWIFSNLGFVLTQTPTLNFLCVQV